MGENVFFLEHNLMSRVPSLPPHQVPRSAACAQRRACSPSEPAGRSPQRKTSWRPSTRSSNPTPSSAPPQDTWPTTKGRACVCERVCVSPSSALFYEEAEPKKNIVLVLLLSAHIKIKFIPDWRYESMFEYVFFFFSFKGILCYSITAQPTAFR